MYSPLPPPQVWTPPEIDVFDVSDDLEQKKNWVRCPERHTGPTPTPHQVWTPVEIDFFDVSDDFEQNNIWYKRFLDLENWK